MITSLLFSRTSSESVLTRWLLDDIGLEGGKKYLAPRQLDPISRGTGPTEVAPENHRCSDGEAAETGSRFQNPLRGGIQIEGLSFLPCSSCPSGRGTATSGYRFLTFYILLTHSTPVLAGKDVATSTKRMQTSGSEKCELSAPRTKIDRFEQCFPGLCVVCAV